MTAKRDYSQESLESEFAYKILREIKGKEINPTKIAEELDTSNTSVNNYLNGLRANNLVKKSAGEGRKVLYQLDEDGFVSLYQKLWKDMYDKWKDSEDRDDALKNFERIKKEILDKKFSGTHHEILITYFDRYMEAEAESTLKNMMLRDLVLGYTRLVSDIGNFEFDIRSGLEAIAFFHLRVYGSTFGKGAFQLIFALKDIEDSSDTLHLFEEGAFDFLEEEENN